MKKTQHENIHVLKPCLQLCASLEAKGLIFEYKRLDAFDYDHKRGSPDIEIRYVEDNILHLILCECKRQDGKGRQLTSQIAYQAKYKSCANVDYIIVESADELRRKIYSITGQDERDSETIKNLDF